MNQGRHWDISDGDIDLSNLQAEVHEKENIEEDVIPEEVEYCAPNTLGRIIHVLIIVILRI